MGCPKASLIWYGGWAFPQDYILRPNTIIELRILVFVGSTALCIEAYALTGPLLSTLPLLIPDIISEIFNISCCCIPI